GLSRLSTGQGYLSTIPRSTMATWRGAPTQVREHGEGAHHAPWRCLKALYAAAATCFAAATLHTARCGWSRPARTIAQPATSAIPYFSPHIASNARYARHQHVLVTVEYAAYAAGKYAATARKRRDSSREKLSAKAARHINYKIMLQFDFATE